MGQVQNFALRSKKVDHFSRGVRTVVGPPARATNATIAFVGDFMTGIRDAHDLRRENERLKGVEESAKRYQVDYDALFDKYESLRAQVDYPLQPANKKVFARVVAFMPFQNRITLDRGGGDGIKPHMAVVSAKGLVGIVETVSPHSCQVLLVTSPALSVPVTVLGDPNVPGIAKGETATKLVINLLESEEVHTGQSVVTSGFSLLVPAGIPVGTVVDSRQDPQFGTQRVFVLPAIEIGEIYEVFVVR